MTNPVNDIFKQAQQGSVAAIIQMLNDKLADSGVRTRAMFADGVLQLLCEAATADQMDQVSLIGRVKQILEAIAPRNIRRVNINSRIVCEQQLLWLDEIRRHPDKLIWSQEIVLKKPNFFQQLQQDWQGQRTESLAGLPTQSPRELQAQRQFKRGGVLGAGSLAVLLLAGWGAYHWVFSGQNSPKSTANAIAPEAKPGAPVPPTSLTPTSDAFVGAVRLAEKAAQQGTVAKTAAEWLAIATAWQQSSDLMAKVPATDPRYKLAEERIATYRQNSEAALQAVQRVRAMTP
jgi:hypothetical protein